MHKGQFIFTQLCQLLPKRAFDCLVDKYEGNKYVKSFTCWKHLLVMIFGQLSNRESIRDLIATLAPYRRQFHHLGFGKSVTRSNLSKANEVRDVRIFQMYAERLMAIARDKRHGSVAAPVDNAVVYAFDSSTISLCLSVFWWTRLHHGKSGVKMHTLYDVTSGVPAFVVITGADVHDSKVMPRIQYERGNYYVFDRAYMDTAQLYAITLAGSYFVVREKRRMSHKVMSDIPMNDENTGVMAVQAIRLTGKTTRGQYPETLRRVTFYDSDGWQDFRVLHQQHGNRSG